MLPSSMSNIITKYLLYAFSLLLLEVAWTWYTFHKSIWLYCALLFSSLSTTSQAYNFEVKQMTHTEQKFGRSVLSLSSKIIDYMVPLNCISLICLFTSTFVCWEYHCLDVSTADTALKPAHSITSPKLVLQERHQLQAMSSQNSRCFMYFFLVEKKAHCVSLSQTFHHYHFHRWTVILLLVRMAAKTSATANLHWLHDWGQNWSFSHWASLTSANKANT